ncbi:MAG: hypothetical protein QOE40_677, partial [Actinomycetota bacterium]|nr:hypothetical protein [Actinomycetota bacterium]
DREVDDRPETDDEAAEKDAAGPGQAWAGDGKGGAQPLARGPVVGR